MRLLLLTLLLLSGTASAAPSPQPDPRHSPREVVGFQLDALHDVDTPSPDAGFATVFRFASPQNQQQTGPLPRFARMIRQGYGELVNHRRARILATVQQGDEALQPVEVTSRSGRVHRYVFLLRRVDTAPCAGCWLTDGVMQSDNAAAGNET